MYLSQSRRILSVALVAAIFAVPSYASSKRRSVRHPSATNLITADINGRVIDSVTGAPVIGAQVSANGTNRLTAADGSFSLRGVSGSGSITVQASRSGYDAGSQSIAAGGTHNLTFRLAPRPTVRVRRQDNSIVELDLETVEFGFPVPFSGYYAAPFESFCTAAGGEPIELHRDQIKRINGPATPATLASCCPGETLKINITLRNGATADYYFTDACDGTRNIDVIGREHSTNKPTYIPFTQVGEVIFP
jgi:hypothetical protein